MAYLLWLATISSVTSVTLAVQPVILAVNPVATLYELETSITKVTDVSCTDADGGTTVIYLAAVSPANAPCSNCFQVYPNCGGGLGSSYCLQFLPIGTFNYDQARSYNLTLLCEDSDSEVSAAYIVDLRLVPNTPPFFSTPGSVTTTLSNTETVQTGGSVYAVGCSDPDSDSLTFTLSSSPSSSLFTIDTSGVIRATGDLSAVCLNSITFEVTCRDPYNDPVGPIYIQTTLNGANEQPSISGINYNLDVPEDEAVGTTLAAYTVSDDDTPTCLLSANPTASLQFFQLDSLTNSLTVKSALNYEVFATRNTNLSVTCSDGFCTSSVAYLYVRVTEVNEPITLYPQDFTLSTYEGTISIDPQWTPVDEDANDSPTYTIVGGNTNGRFAIDPTTGIITSTLEYDVDQGAMPTTDTLVVQVEDTGGHSSSTTVTLTILDSNDNRPVFTSPSQTITVTDCASNAGSTIGTAVVATDDDSSFQGNNVITYSGGSGPITIGSGGNIIAGSGLSAGSTYVVQATATDSGQVPGPLSSSPDAFITVIVTACPTTTTAPPTTTAAPATTAAPPATTASPTSGGNGKQTLDENLGWVVVAALLATVLLAALIFMLWRL